ncbi:hypothetical protein [Christiangramia sp. OXR-203]|uniref:hypothetical protein n=1 Tax=Christiangramia sp. OXR-203 TaxID=3100176 RepID=UPI002AC9B451|nr:hypothetical protein [Christiangramia sp. OXR-203]WPY98926.1 hypothetical protein T8I65_01610 [Christiangramia sp. OXR-203]
MRILTGILIVLIFIGCKSHEDDDKVQHEIKKEVKSNRTETKLFADSLKVIYRYSGDTIFEDHIDLKGTSDDNYDSSFSMTSVWSTREMDTINCSQKLFITQENMIFSYCLSDVMQRIENDIKNSGEESWNLDRLKKLEKELVQIEKGKRDSLTFKSYHLNFLVLKELQFSAYDKVSKHKASKIKVGKYLIKFRSGNSSGGTHYYLLTKENDTIGEFQIREWIT